MFPSRQKQADEKFPVYYTGLFGDNSPTVRVSGNAPVELPKTGEAFPFLCTEFMFRLLQQATALTIDGKGFCAVTKNKNEALRAKNQILGIAEPEPTVAVLSDEALLKELERRNLNQPVSRKKKEVTTNG